MSSWFRLIALRLAVYQQSSLFKLNLAILIALLCSCSAYGPASADCLASFRDIKFPDGSARVKNYVCKSEGAGSLKSASSSIPPTCFRTSSMNSRALILAAVKASREDRWPTSADQEH